MGSIQKPGSVVDDIAVVGLACRFPGGASNSAKFWDLLADRRSAHSEAPSSRYNANGFHHPADKLNTLSCRGGHFLEGDVAAFDAPFFNITAQEAKAMDPTARMLLEVTYEAFENAGIPIENLAGSQTSCYVGCFTRDYHEMLMRDAETSPMYAGTGTGFSLLSNRISWFYDLRGPSMTLDTACSSSLVGLHLACQGLRTGESKVAVVSGANLILSPDLAMWLSNLHMTSKDGLSRSFADGTTGYGRGEGIATLILKPLTDALHDGDAIRAVIRGTGVNQDGHTTGITVPNSLAQADLIRSTYRSAGLDFSQTGYFEAHGTGTAVGDPLELAAVAKTLAEVRKLGDSLFVGSVKSNIGHLEGAAGLAGVIKCILMLENGTILPNIHFDKPNKRIPFESWKIQVPTSLIPWPSNFLRRASVNSFGYGGTNAHAILDSANEYLLSKNFHLDQSPSISEDGPTRIFGCQQLFVFGARDEAALDRMRIEYINHLERIESMPMNQTRKEEQIYLDRMSFSLSHRRSRFDWKAHVTASSIMELKKVLSMSKFNPIRSTSEPRIAFIFTGQGVQWARMGIELLKYPVFNSGVVNAEAYLRVLGCEWSVMEELEKGEDSSSIQLAKISQPMCTILQVALIDLLRSWNIKPSAVVGHSSGEIGAAYCYGAITRESAWKISYWRGKLCSGLRSEAPELKGAMMAVGLSVEAAQEYIPKIQQGKVVVACVNSPSSVTISGDDATIDELLEVLKTNSVFCRKLKVENAYHSQHMELIAQRYLDCITDIQIMEPTSSAKNMKMASSVTGDLITHAELGPTYWVRNLVSPVLFSNAVQALSTDTTQKVRRRTRAGESSLDFLLEVGPHAALKGPLRQILQTQSITNFAYGSMVFRGEDASLTAARVAGILHCRGTHVKISEVNMLTKLPRPLTDLPSYPWNHSLTYWSESRLSQNYRSREHGRHDLLGSQALGSDDIDPKWRHFLKVSENPWIQDHVVHSSILYPGAGIIAMPIEAIRQIADKDKEIESIQLRDVRISKAIVISETQDGVETFLQLRRQLTGPNKIWNGWWEFTVNTHIEDQEPQQNGSGLVSIRYKVNPELQWATGKNIEFEALKQELSDAMENCLRRIEPTEFYKATAKAGLQYGPLFQGLTELHAGKGYCRCVISIPNTKAKMPEQVESPHLIHPTTLDIIFHSLFAALGEEGMEFTNAAVPIAFESLFISGDLPSGANSKFSGFCHATRSGSREVVADIYMSDMAWDEPKIQIKGIRCRELPGIASSTPPTKAPCGTLLWKPDIDHLDAHLLRCYLEEKSSGCLDNESPIESEEEIYKVIELAAFKNPELSILQIGRAASKFTSSILSVLGTRSGSSQLFSKYTLADKDSQQISKAEERFRNDKTNITYNLLDQTLQLESSQYADDSFDIIFVSIAIDTIVEQQHLISSIERILKSGGYVLALQLHNGLHWSNSLSHSGFTPLVLRASTRNDAVEEKQSKSDSWYIARKLKNSTVEESQKPILLLTPQDSSDRIIAIANEIAELSSRQGLQVETISWPPKVPVVLSHPVISLLELEKTFLSDISSQDFNILKIILLETSSMLWVTNGEDPIMNTAVGYLRSVKNENPNLSTRYLRLEDRLGRSASSFADTIIKAAVTPSIEREYVEIKGCLNINRWIADEGMGRMLVSQEAFDSHEHMAIGESYEGLDLVLRNLKQPASFYFDAKLDSVDELRPTEVEIEVKAISLNAEDLETSDQDHELSIKEFSGFVVRVGKKCARVQPGDRVCALTIGPYSTLFRVEEALCNQIPLQVTFEDASCWPITFGTAYQSLVRVAKLQAGKTILIQAAASAPGQASVQLAKSLGAIVHATVSSEEECRIVESWGIPRSRIFSDISDKLSADLKRFTRGKGFDVILNFSRISERLCDLWLLTAPFGVFVDASKSTSSNDAALGITPFRRGSTFSVVNLEIFLQTDFSLLADILEGATSSMTKYKIHSVTSRTVFPANTISMGFEYLQNHGNVGKTVISFNNRQQVPISPNARKPISLDKKYTYIIAGGLGGLGQSLAQLLVEIGAKNIVFLSRSGVKSEDSQKLMETLAASHVLAKSYACDISDEQAMKNVLQQYSEEMPPIKGVIQSAAVLNDSVYDNMTHDMWQAAIRPKIQGSKLLHDLLPKNMDFFVMLSSISGVVGNRSQANYAAGNTFQDELAQYRRRQGLPAVSIDLGLMLDIGLIAQRGGSTNLKKSEAVGLYENDFHAIVKAAIAGSYGLSKTPGQLITGLPTGGILQMGGLEEPFYYDDPRFSIMRKTGLKLIDSEIGEDGASSGAADAISQLSQCSSLQEAARLISTALCVRLAKALETVSENIDSGKPLHTYGVDSLMAVDFRTWIISQVKAEISLFDILSGGSIETLASKIAMTSKLVPVEIDRRGSLDERRGSLSKS